ncbi:F-box/LRR-repeat protein At3g26922-like [Nicotiana tabacum]|uniref:F-box/LRR-repeat protein At3g26922-like n=1 Tax=Nicotiana tabacum TaxID=4097 RepID=A0AC58T3A0_TOBAC
MVKAGDVVKKGRTAKGEVKDMICELPNCLLASILSLLSIKDAVKTNVLSHRWKRLFMLIPNLVIDSPNIFSDDQDHQRFTLSSYKALEKERREFVMRVDQFMQLMHMEGIYVPLQWVSSCIVNFHLI